jgi:hypothetical protein
MEKKGRQNITNNWWYQGSCHIRKYFITKTNQISMGKKVRFEGLFWVYLMNLWAKLIEQFP